MVIFIREFFTFIGVFSTLNFFYKIFIAYLDIKEGRIQLEDEYYEEDLDKDIRCKNGYVGVYKCPYCDEEKEVVYNGICPKTINYAIIHVKEHNCKLNKLEDSNTVTYAFRLEYYKELTKTELENYLDKAKQEG